MSDLIDNTVDQRKRDKHRKEVDKTTLYISALLLGILFTILGIVGQIQHMKRKDNEYEDWLYGSEFTQNTPSLWLPIAAVVVIAVTALCKMFG